MAYTRMICQAGKTRLVKEYYSFNTRPKGSQRAAKQNLTSEAQQKVNDKQKERKLTALLNENFDETSWYATFSYKRRPETIEELQKHIEKLLRDLRRAYKKAGIVFQYIWTAEVGPRGATHIHMVASEIDPRVLRDAWSHGWVNLRPLDHSGQYSRLASYFIKYFQKTRKTDSGIQKKAYNPSRNLKQPKVTRKPLKGNTMPRDIRIPKGWYVDKNAFQNGEGMEWGINGDGYEYRYYILVKVGDRDETCEHVSGERWKVPNKSG